MSSVDLPPDQLALYIALPLTLSFILTLCICYCYKRHKLCFKDNKGEALLSDDKVRFTVDLSKKGRRKKGFGPKRHSKENSPQAETGNDQQQHQQEELVFNSIANPTFVQTPAVGQSLKSQSVGNDKKNIAEVDLLKSPQESQHHVLSFESSDPKIPLSPYGATGRQANSVAAPSILISNSQNLSHTPADGQQEKKRLSLSQANVHAPVESADLDGHDENFGSYGLLLNLDLGSSQNLQQSGLKSPFEDLRGSQFNLNKANELQVDGPSKVGLTDGLHKPNEVTSPSHGPTDSTGFPPSASATASSPLRSPTMSDKFMASTMQSSAGRRRSSMQMPIDLRQIDPSLYKFQTERMPSMDSDPGEDTAIIHFSLNFQKSEELLTIKIIQANTSTSSLIQEVARNLPIQEFSGTTDPYVIVSLTPGSTQRKSRIHRRTNNPEFEETYTFVIGEEDIKDKSLEIRLFDFDQYSRDECIAMTKINLSEIDFEMMPSVDLWKPFKLFSERKTRKDSAVFGDLMVALSYLRSAEKLTLAVQKARNLQSPDGKQSLPDSYVKVCVFKGGQRLKKKKTSVIRASTNPVFNQSLTFSIPIEIIQANDVRVLCCVVHELKLGYNVDLGYLEIGPGCGEVEEQTHWNEMLTQPANKPLARWHTLKEQHTTVEAPSTSSDSKPALRRKSVAAAVAQVDKLNAALSSAALVRRSFS